MATITVTVGNVNEGTGEIRATVDACHIMVDDLEVLDGDSVPKQYRFRIEPNDPTLVGSGYSHLFTPNSEGKHWWDGYIFPAADTWTVSVHDELEDDEIESEQVEVV